MATLVGREPELGRLSALVADVAGGAAAGALVVGVAGSGKTALLDDVEVLSKQQGLQVLRTTARPVALERPLGAIAPLLGIRTAPTSPQARVLPDGAVGGSAVHSLADAAADAVERLAMDAPVALLVDDLHYADGVTALTLNGLAGRVDFPLLLVVTSRPPTTALATLTRIDLGPLDADAVVLLAEQQLGHPPDDALRAALVTAAGNALLAEDIVRGGGISILARVGALERSVLDVAQALHILGDGTTCDDLRAVVESEDIADALGTLTAARFVRQDHGTARFRHDLYRAAIGETIGAAAARELHRKAAALRSAQRDRALDATEHAALGAEAGSIVAADALRSAAADAVETAPRAALSLLDRALTLGIDERPIDTITRIRAVGAAGEMLGAESLCRALLRDSLPPEVERQALRELAFACFTQNRPGEAVAAMDRVSTLADDAGAARANAESSFAAAVALDFGGADQRSRSAIEGSGDHVTQSIANSVQCLLANFTDRLRDARQFGDLAVSHAEGDGGEEARRYQPWFCSALARMECDELDEALGLINTGRQVAKLTGSAWALPGYDALEAFTLVRKGELDDAAAAATAVLPCIGTTDGLRVGAWAHATLARVALHRGDLKAARVAYHAGQALLDSGEVMLGSDQVALVHGRLLAAEGRSAEAREVLSTTWELLGMIGVDRPRHELGTDLVRLSLETGDAGRAHTVAEELAAAARRVPTPTARLEAARARLLTDRTLTNAQDVTAAAAACPRRLTAAQGLVEAGVVLKDVGLLVEAARMFAERGADADLATIERLLPAGAARLRPRLGWDSLTATERAVLSLVADGLPNAAIADQLSISRRTVESHVSAAYRKLGVRTRVDLARAATAHRVS